VANLGSLEGAIIGTFQIPTGRASGDIITVADAGIGANSQVFLQPQGTGGAITFDLALTQVTAGTGFQCTISSTGATTAAITVAYIRTA
jgi:hypothetical protein